MTGGDEEDVALRSVALQNAQSILLARQRAEQELVRAKEALERKTQQLAHSLSVMRATLDSTWDGILVTADDGRITGYNQTYVDMWRVPTERIKLRRPFIVAPVHGLPVRRAATIHCARR